MSGAAGVVLAGVFFYVGWFAATSAQSFHFLGSSASASTSATNTAGNTNGATNTGSNTAGAPEGAPAAASSTPADPYASTYTSGAQVVIDGTPINVALSTTTAEIDQGLQNRPTLATNDGMLFIFNSAKIYQFWMPNMSFSLDMIWIGSDMKVVDISRDAPPLPDPTKPVWFRPSSPAQYVLEVNANYAAEHNINIGDSVQFVSVPE